MIGLETLEKWKSGIAEKVAFFIDECC